MTEAELLKQIKYRLGITGNYHDNLLSSLATDVKDYLCDAGVPTTVVESNASVGVIARGVSDLWNFGSGDGKFSDVFYQRAIQLTMRRVDESNDSNASSNSNVKMVRYTNDIVTDSDNFSQFPIGIRIYNKNTDMLSIYINGLRVSDYEYNEVGGTVILNKPLRSGQTILVEVMHLEVSNG